MNNCLEATVDYFSLTQQETRFQQYTIQAHRDTVCTRKIFENTISVDLFNKKWSREVTKRSLTSLNF